MASMVKKLNAQIPQNNDKEWGGIDLSKTWNVDSELNENGLFSNFGHVNSFEESMEWQDCGHHHETIPPPKSSPMILTSSGKARMPTRKKIKKGSLLVHLSPKVCINEPSTTKSNLPNSIESCSPAIKDDMESKKKLEKRSVFQGNLHGVLEGGVAFVPTVAFNNYEKARKPSKRDEEPAPYHHEQPYGHDSYSVSVEDSSSIDVREDPCDDSSIVSCSYSNTSNSSKEVKQERNGINLAFRDRISSQIIQLANGPSQETKDMNEPYQNNGVERHQKNVTSNDKLVENQKPKGLGKEVDRKSQRMVQFEKETSNNKMDGQRKGIVKGFTRKGKNPVNPARERTIDLCISAKKMEVQKHDLLLKAKSASHPCQLASEPFGKQDIYAGLVMNENAIANSSFEEGDAREEALDKNELLLFSSRNGQRASIRDNSIFQNMERQCIQGEQKPNKDMQGKQFNEVIINMEQEDESCDLSLRETIGTHVSSSKNSMDLSNILNSQQTMARTEDDDKMSTTWSRKSYELGEKILNDIHKENMESSCMKLEWSQPKQDMNDIKFSERRYMLSQSMENFRSNFGGCEPLDLEKIEIEEPPSNSCLFLDFDVTNASVESISQYPEQKQVSQSLVCTEKKEVDNKSTNWELSVAEPQRPWSASCVYDDTKNNTTNGVKDVDHYSKVLYMDPPRSYEEYAPGSRLNRLQTLRKAVLKDVSLRAEKHRMHLQQMSSSNRCIEYKAQEPSNESSAPQYLQNSETNISVREAPACIEDNNAKVLTWGLVPRVVDDNVISNKHFNSYENFRNSDTLQVLTIVAGSDLSCTKDDKQVSPKHTTYKATTKYHENPSTCNDYDNLIQDLTRKYSKDDTKSPTKTSNSNFKSSNTINSEIDTSNGVEETKAKEDSKVDSPLPLAIVPSPYIMDSNKHGVKLDVDAKDQITTAGSPKKGINITFSQLQPLESQQKKACEILSRVPQNDRTSLSAEKLSSILSYLGQVEESNQEEGSIMVMPKVCESLYGESSPRTVLDYEDALSVAASSSVSTASPLTQRSERSCVDGFQRSERSCTDGFQIVRHGSAIPATIPVLDSVRKKMQELKEKIIYQESRITSIETEKKKLTEDQETILQQEKEKLRKELEARAAEYSMAIQHHLSLNEKMVKDKEMLSEKCCTLTVLVNSTESRFEEKLKTLNERWLKDLSKQKELWSIGEKSKREAWMEKKTKELKELTIKGLEPHLENVADKHKQEIRLLETRHAEELRKQLEQQSIEHLRNITQLRERLLGERDDFIDKERLAAHIRMNEVAERYEQQAIQQRMHVANELTSKLEKLEATRREEKLLSEDLINRLQKEISERDAMFADHVGKAADKILQEKEKNMREERDKMASELQSWQQSFDQILHEELKKKEKEIQSRCQKERDEQIELILEKLEKERDLEIAQTQKNGRSRLEDLLGDKRELLKKLKDQETQSNLLRKDLIEEKLKIEKDLAESSLQINSLQRECNWQAHLIDQLKQQAEQERIVYKTREDTLLSNIQEYKLQLQKCTFEVQDMKDRKVEDLAELEARVKLAILKKDSVIEGLKHQLIVAQKQIQQTEILLQEEQRAIVAEL